jgi:hypothetical protein
MLNTLLKKLIKTASGRFRFYLSIAGLTIALLLILAGVQLQSNYNELLYGKANRDSVANFLVINKDVNSAKSTLSAAEIQDLRSQPFIKSVGLLTPSKFKVSAETNSDKFPLYTDLFLESVPDEFLDVNDPKWKWSLNSGYIPVIIPNMFLDMYNFGFAVSQGTPQLTPDAIKLITLKLSVHAMGRKFDYPAQIVGFSDRISSVLVPQAFMDWANENFGAANTEASRVIIRTDDTGDPRLVQYLKDHGLKTDADKTRFSKYRQIVDTVVNASWITGAVLLLFALLVFTLFIQLTVASCKEEINLLVQLGTAPNQLRRFLMKRFFPPNIFIIVLVLILISGLQYFLQQFLARQSMVVESFISVYTIAAAVLILFVLWLVNFLTLQKYVSKTSV